MLLKIAIFFAVIVTAYCDTPFRQCENGADIPIKVQMNDCVEEPCILKAGKPLNANITFDAPYDIEIMKNVVNVTFGTTELEFQVDKDCCKSLLRGWCPLEVGERAVYNFKMSLPIIIPELSITLEVQLMTTNKDGTMKTIKCFEIPCKTIPIWGKSNEIG